MAETTNRTSLEDLNRANIGKLPEHLGLAITYGVSTAWPDGATGFNLS